MNNKAKLTEWTVDKIAITYLSARRLADGRYAYRRGTAYYPGRPDNGRRLIVSERSLRRLGEHLETAAQVRADRADGYEYARSGNAYGDLASCTIEQYWAGIWAETDAPQE